MTPPNEENASLARRRSPQVSVVMSSFNDEAHIAKAVQSIQLQSLSDWEFIIVNDGSTDGTGKILDQFAEADPRIRVIHQENSGLTKALIRGCQEACADYIARQDADDISLPRRLELQHRLLSTDGKVSLVSCFADYIGPKNEFLSTVTRPADNEEATSLLLHKRMGSPAHGTVMFRKSVYDQVGGYRAQFYYAQDGDLWLRMAEVAHVAYVQESCYRLRLHAKSITGSNRSFQKEFGIISQQCRQSRHQREPEQPYLDAAAALTVAVTSRRRRESKAVNQSNSNQIAMTYLIGSKLVMNRDSRARAYLWQIIRQSPSHWKAWVRLAQSLLSGKKREARSEEL